MVAQRSFKLGLAILGILIVAIFAAPIHTTEALSGEPCFVSIIGVGIEVRAGPSVACPVVAFWLTDVPLPVTGKAFSTEGELWWQLRLTGLAQAWVPQSAVFAGEACDLVEHVPAPVCPVCPTCPASPRYLWCPYQSPAWQPPAASRGWGECGSCSTCGFDPYECVLSPEGQCLWDPTTCEGAGPPAVDTGWGECGSCSNCGPYNPAECILSPEGVCLWDPADCRAESACVPEPGILTCPAGLEPPFVETFVCPGDSRCQPEWGYDSIPVQCTRSACFDTCGALAGWTGYCGIPLT